MCSWKRDLTKPAAAAAVAGLLFLLLTPDSTPAQPSRRASHQHGRQQASSQSGASIAEQLRELRSKVAKLEAALQKKHTGKGHSSTGAHGGKAHDHGQSDFQGSPSHAKSGRKGMKPGRGMSKMESKMAMGKKSMSGSMKSGMGMMKGGMGMGMMGRGMNMMGRMKGMGKMSMPSALPGFPGASHIYHIGATGFFLDHPQHITLGHDQKTKLNKFKEETLLKQATFDRRIEEAEQGLWVLTSAEKPDAAKIEAKIREITKLAGDKRIAFIRVVGQAANVLTDEQRKRLVGILPADHKAASGKQ